MEIANSMRGITENIITSYDARVRALGDLVMDTRKTLKGFASDRKKMAREQAESLAHFTRGLSKSVEEMLRGFRKDHQQMSEEQTESLTDFMKDLTNGVSSMLGGFQKDRGKMSKELKGRLAKEVREIETYIENKLNEFDETHTEMSEQQKKDLAKFVSGMTSEVKRLLAGYRNDINGASRAWKGMAATLAKARKGGPVMPRIEAGERVTTVEEAVEKKGKKGRGKAKGK